MPKYLGNTAECRRQGAYYQWGQYYLCIGHFFCLLKFITITLCCMISPITGEGEAPLENCHHHINTCMLSPIYPHHRGWNEYGLLWGDVLPPLSAHSTCWSQGQWWITTFPLFWQRTPCTYPPPQTLLVFIILIIIVMTVMMPQGLLSVKCNTDPSGIQRCPHFYILSSTHRIEKVQIEDWGLGMAGHHHGCSKKGYWLLLLLCHRWHATSTTMFIVRGYGIFFTWFEIMGLRYDYCIISPKLFDLILYSRDEECFCWYVITLLLFFRIFVSCLEYTNLHDIILPSFHRIPTYYVHWLCALTAPNTLYVWSVIVGASCLILRQVYRIFLVYCFCWNQQHILYITTKTRDRDNKKATKAAYALDLGVVLVLALSVLPLPLHIPN